MWGFRSYFLKKNRVKKVRAGHNYLHQCEFESHCPNPRVKIVDELKPWQIYPLPVFEASDHDLSFHVRVNMDLRLAPRAYTGSAEIIIVDSCKVIASNPRHFISSNHFAE